MRIYSRTGATLLDHPEVGQITADDDGGFDLPHEVAETLLRFGVGGKPLFEDELQRNQRILREEMERRRDPATLMAAMQRLVEATEAAADKPAAKRPAKKTAAAPPAE